MVVGGSVVLCKGAKCVEGLSLIIFSRYDQGLINKEKNCRWKRRVCFFLNLRSFGDKLEREKHSFVGGRRRKSTAAF